MDIRVLQRSQSCCMKICQIHLESEQESKYLTTLYGSFQVLSVLNSSPILLRCLCYSFASEKAVLSQAEQTRLSDQNLFQSKY